MEEWYLNHDEVTVHPGVCPDIGLLVVVSAFQVAPSHQARDYPLDCSPEGVGLSLLEGVRT